MLYSRCNYISRQLRQVPPAEFNIGICVKYEFLIVRLLTYRGLTISITINDSTGYLTMAKLRRYSKHPSPYLGPAWLNSCLVCFRNIH